MRDQATIRSLLNSVQPDMLLHTSFRIPAARGCTTLVWPLATIPGQDKAVIVFDLMADPRPLLELDAADIRDRVFTPAADLPADVERIPLKVIRINQVPMVAPAAVLRGVDTDRIGLDPERCRRHAEMLGPHGAALRSRIAEVFASRGDGAASAEDPDGMLYGGFFSTSDRHQMNKILGIDPRELGGYQWSFQDQRLPEMLFRYRARNYPDSLSTSEHDAWEKDRIARLLNPTLDGALSFAEFPGRTRRGQGPAQGRPGSA